MATNPGIDKKLLALKRWVAVLAETDSHCVGQSYRQVRSAAVSMGLWIITSLRDSPGAGCTVAAARTMTANIHMPRRLVEGGNP